MTASGTDPVRGDAARRIVVIGGVAGGMSAATRLRRRDEHAQIIVLERGGEVSFANCGLPYYVGGVIDSRDALLLQTPASLGARFALDVRVHHEATALDRAARVVRGRHTIDGTPFEIPYDELVLAPGAAPFLPPVPGIERALTLRSMGDVDALRAATDAEPRAAVVLGGGFIGLELAENLHARGVAVTVVELADQLLAPLDVEMSALVRRRLLDAGVRVSTGVSATRIDEAGVDLSDGSRTDAELVIAAIGVRPDSGLAADAGLEVDERGGIVVDDRQRTSDAHIWAVGDAAVKRDAGDGARVLVPLAQTANRHGRLVADALTGRDVRALPVLGTAIVGVFGLQVAAVGWNERRARAAGRPVRVVHTHPASHAGYYPGAAGMHLKLVVDASTDAILGAQGVGEDGVDKRIDVIATAMRGGLTASDLADLELAYAPQFGSAKDPVNMLGMIADNLRSGDAATIQWHELAAAQAAGESLVDVRTPAEFAAGAIPGAVNVPVDELRERLDELPAGPLVVHCQVGLRGHVASRLLSQHGRQVRNLDGGYATWAAARP